MSRENWQRKKIEFLQSRQMDKEYSLHGVILKSDYTAKDDRCLGAVKLYSSQILDVTLGQFRDVMREQLICCVEKFQFCSEQG